MIIITEKDGIIKSKTLIGIEIYAQNVFLSTKGMKNMFNYK